MYKAPCALARLNYGPPMRSHQSSLVVTYRLDKSPICPSSCPSGVQSVQQFHRRSFTLQTVFKPHSFRSLSVGGLTSAFICLRDVQDQDRPWRARSRSTGISTRASRREIWPRLRSCSRSITRRKFVTSPRGTGSFRTAFEQLLKHRQLYLEDSWLFGYPQAEIITFQTFQG